ncbi:MAG: serine/threonine protein kinase [Elusimicrobia bacterium]|nr:serine/threonine protein kinase [Elusimicrobiota bacterium]
MAPSILLLLALAAHADEYTDSDYAVKNAKHSSVKEIKRALQQPGPAFGPAGTDAGFEDRLKRLDDAVALLGPKLDRLERLATDYALQEDLAPFAQERNRLRREVAEAGAAFANDLEEFETLRMGRVFGTLESMTHPRGPKDPPMKDFLVALKINQAGRPHRDAKVRVREALALEEEAYRAAQDALARRRAREARRRRWTAWAGLAAALLLTGAAALRLRRRPRKGLAPAAGSVVAGTYRLDRVHGANPTGILFEATDLVLKRKVTVKQLFPELKASRRDLQRFLSEARLVAGLKHPNIVEVFAIVDDAADLHIVCELPPGKPLDAILERGPLALTQTASLLRQVGAALDYAHRQAVIHRDLKPAHVMVSPEGGAKVTDFGLAYQADLTLARLTKLVVAPSAYMAPEQELGAPSRASDLFSLGALAYAMLTGRAPFTGPDSLGQKRLGNFPPPSRALNGLPESLDPVLARALHPDPRARFSTGAELADALAVFEKT